MLCQKFIEKSLLLFPVRCLVLATASSSLSDVIDGGVPRTMGERLEGIHSLSTHSHDIR